jgi:hypothetical protein
VDQEVWERRQAADAVMRQVRTAAERARARCGVPSSSSKGLRDPPGPDGLNQVRALVRLGYIRRYRDWSIANRPKATNPSATAVSRNLPKGCARIVCSAPSSPCAFCRSKVSVA